MNHTTPVNFGTVTDKRGKTYVLKTKNICFARLIDNGGDWPWMMKPKSMYMLEETFAVAIQNMITAKTSKVHLAVALVFDTRVKTAAKNNVKLIPSMQERSFPARFEGSSPIP